MNVIAEQRKFEPEQWLLVAILVAGIAVAGYFYATSSQKPLPILLRIGILPDQGQEALRQRYAPLANYLALQSGIETRLIIPDTYLQTLEFFRDGKLDLVYFGGLTFVQAQTGFGAEPLVMREIDTRFVSWFITRPEDAQKQISDLRGRRLLFGSQLSTSGHLMPRHFLQQQWKVDPEYFFSEIGYSGAHDDTAYQVRNGQYDVGAINAGIARQMIEDGRIGEQDLRVIWQTPPYPDYVWAVRQGLDESLKNKLRDAFLRLDGNNSPDHAILTALDAKLFLPAGSGDFRTLTDIASRMDLLDTGSR